MVNIYDLAMLTFSSVTANHLGLIAAAEKILKRSLPVLNCPKCCTFWLVLLSTVLTGWNMVSALATSFLCAYLSLWLNLLFAFIDKQFNLLYDKIYSTTDNTHDGTEHT